MKRIESPQNALVKHWKKLLSVRKERDKTGEFIIEGYHLVEEAIKQKENVLTIMVSDTSEIPETWDIENLVVVEINDLIKKELAETEHTQGIFAHCKQQTVNVEEQDNWNRLLLIDAVQDPGNIGTMIRTADAAGIDAVVLGKGSADAYNSKTLRSAQGSHFHLPIVKGDLFEWVEKLKERNVSVYGTAFENSTPFNEVKKEASFALIVGNEGNGINSELLEQTDQNIIVPLLGQAESLNVAVATGILLYGLTLK
ncbi:RNA methyltransferase, TrmH family [Psychrobacillus sp. OK028]|uniref:TrmH family RNA methyltransferase n=1 Tax=Psychrobacillus sp. OK028 TaxID=1884359 RepID=UPI00088CA967|nr:RNA methyltransferase [Psychrobacillus sp. OK028]SDM76165.1 RNA methyltransferase, TrmH family [Psychrobacillus sp. OK028]